MAFWSGAVLEQRIRAEKIVFPFDPEQIDCAACTLHLGDEVYVTPDAEDANASSTTKRRLAPKQSVSIPAGQFAFLLTKERLKIPRNVLGFISMRTSIKFRGLINVSGFHVDPGYEGRLIFAVYNGGPVPVHVAEGEALFLLWLSSVEGDIESSMSGRKYYKMEPGFSDISSELIQKIPGKVLSLQTISENMGKLRSEIDVRLSQQQPIIENLHFIFRALVISGLVSAAGIVLVAGASTAINTVDLLFHYFR